MGRCDQDAAGFITRMLGRRGAFALAAILGFSIAQAQTLDFRVPGGDLKEALAAYVRQTGVQLVYREDDIRGLRSEGVSGSLPTDEALARILAGTSLIVQRDASGAIAIGRPAPARKAVEATPPSSARLEKTALYLAQADAAPALPAAAPAAAGPVAVESPGTRTPRTASRKCSSPAATSAASTT